MKRSHGKKDASSDSLDAYALKCGAQIIKCSQFAALGFDRIYLFKGTAYITEIKNPARSWELTDTEELQRERCLKSNVPYNIIETPVQMAAMFGLCYSSEDYRQDEKRQRSPQYGFRPLR